MYIKCLRRGGDSEGLLHQGQQVPRGVREPRDGQGGEDHGDLLLLRLQPVQQWGSQAG